MQPGCTTISNENSVFKVRRAARLLFRLKLESAFSNINVPFQHRMTITTNFGFVRFYQRLPGGTVPARQPKIDPPLERWLGIEAPARPGQLHRMFAALFHSLPEQPGRQNAVGHRYDDERLGRRVSPCVGDTLDLSKAGHNLFGTVRTHLFSDHRRGGNWFGRSTRDCNQHYQRRRDY
jgi:hypothetical protein